jgi:hypothetical protein
MARKKAIEDMGEVHELHPVPIEHDIEEKDDEELAIENAIAELGGESDRAIVRVFRVTDRRNTGPFVGDMSPEEFSLDELAKRFGNGKYHVMLYSGWPRRLKKRAVIEVDLAGYDKTEEKAPAQPVQQAQDISPVIQLLQAGFEKITQTIAQSNQQLLSALVSQQTNRKQMLEEMAVLKSLFASESKGVDSLGIVQVALDLAEKIKPREGDVGTGEIILRAIETLGKPLAEIIAEANKEKMKAPAPPVLSQPPLPSPPISENQPISSLDKSDIEMLVKFYLNILITNAEKGNDPETYANMICDLVGEEKAREFALRPDWWTMLLAQDSRVAKYQPWFESLRNIILEMTSSDDLTVKETSGDTKSNAS